MENNTDYLKAYYENYDEDGRLRSRHGMVEYLTTMRYIEKYLKENDRILEIGAGTGRYSHALAQKGYRVDAVELIEHNIDIFKSRTTDGEKISVTRGNALDLSAFDDCTYDITLLLGPMYHLYSVQEQKRALSEAIRVTRPEGIVFAAYCSNDATIVLFCFGRGMLKSEHYKALVDPETFKASSTPEELFELYRKEDIDSLMADFPVDRLHYVGTDMATNYMREVVDSIDDELYELFLKYHFCICERQDMVGVSHHILDVFRKKSSVSR